MGDKHSDNQGQPSRGVGVADRHGVENGPELDSVWGVFSNVIPPVTSGDPLGTQPHERSITDDLAVRGLTIVDN
ncbi:hypothetical protein GCM10009642_38280 [Nocardiopsis metallicus]